VATLPELEKAFVAADSAGNTEDAAVFAAEIKRQRAQATPRRALDIGSTRTAKELPTSSNQVARTKFTEETQKIAQQNAQPGVPLDPEASLPAGTRARLSLESVPAKQAIVLAQQPGVLAARVAKDGKNVIATIAGEDGKPKEVLLNPRNTTLTGSDIAGAAFPLAKAGVAGGLAALTGGMSLLPQALVLGTGTALTQAIGEGASRAEAGQDIDPKNLLANAGKEGALNAALPLVGAAGGATIKGAGNLYRSGIGAVEKNAAAAAARQELPLSASLATGSPALAQAEKVAGTTGIAEEQAALAAAKNRALGQSPTVAGPQKIATESEIAGQVKPIIAADAAAADASVKAGFTDAERAAQARIQDQLNQNLIPPALSQKDAGNFIRSKVVAARDAFKGQAEKNYGDLYALADKEGLTIPTDPLTKLTKDITAEDPHGAVEQIVPEVRRIFGLEAKLNPAATAGKPTGLLDQFGKPVLAAAEAPPPVTLQQAIKLRAVINDSIQQGEALGNIPTSYLKRMAGALTDAIDQGVKTGSANLQKAAKVASDAYAEGAAKLEAADVGKLFKSPETGAAVGDDEIIPALFRGRGNLDALTKLKAVLGPASNDYKLLLRQGLQSLLETSPGQAGNINASTFLSKLNNLSPDMVAELGPVVESLRKTGALLAKAQGVEIPETVLADALASSPGQAAQKLTAAIAKEQAVNQQYQTAVMKGLRDGTVDPQTISADKFVRSFLGSGDAAQVKSALAQIGAKSPEAVEAIRQRALKNILDEAGVYDVQRGLTEDLDRRVLESYANNASYAEALGFKGVQFLEDMQAYAMAQAKRAANSGLRDPQAHGEIKEVAGALTGSVRDTAGSLYDLAMKVPRYALGKALAKDSVKEFFATGQLPSLSPVTKASILATPEILKSEEEMRRGKQLPLAKPFTLPPVLPLAQ
jgi:hypothetical protein